MAGKAKPVVTIGIPFFNPGPLIEDAVRSVFSQTFSDWELILLDDGSTDESLRRVQQIRDPRVKVYSDGRNKGLVTRLNEITQLASGKYLARMDADDIMHPERIATQIQFLESNTTIDVVDTGMVILDRTGCPVGTQGLAQGIPSPVSFMMHGGIRHATIVARREWFLRYPYDEAFPRAEDRELFNRALISGTTFAHLPEPLYFYRYAGNVRVDAYLIGYRSERKVLLRYGPQLIGYPLTTALYVRSCVKSLILRGLALVGAEQFAQRRTYQGISGDLAQKTKESISAIRAQEVPGWD